MGNQMSARRSWTLTGFVTPHPVAMAAANQPTRDADALAPPCLLVIGGGVYVTCWWGPLRRWSRDRVQRKLQMEVRR